MDGIAPAIDSAAYALLEKINVMATPSNYDEMTASEELQNLVCALDTAQTVVSTAASEIKVNELMRLPLLFCRRSSPGNAQ